MKTGWRSASFSDVCVKTQTVDPTKSPDQIFTYVDVSSVSNKTFRIEQVSEIAGGDAPSRARKRIETGDVIFATVRPTLMRVAQIPPELHGHVCSTGYVVLRPDEELDARFLYYSLFRSEFREAMERLQAGASYPAVTDRQVLQQHIPLPPLGDQKRIVAVLDQAFAALDRARTHAEANMVDAEELFESQRATLLAGAARGAPVRELGSISSRVSVGHVGETSKHYVEDGGVPFIRSQNVRPAGLDVASVRQITRAFHAQLKKSRLVGGELLFVRVGANRSDCCKVPMGRGEMNCANIVFARPIEGNLSYLEQFCQSRIGRKLLLGMTTGSAQGVINTKSVATLLIPFPTLESQDLVVEKIEALKAGQDRLSEIYRANISSVANLRQSLLQKAFSGQLT